MLTCDNDSAAFALWIRDRLDGNVERVVADNDGLVGKGGEAELLKCVVGIGDEFTEEDLPRRRNGNVIFSGEGIHTYRCEYKLQKG